MLTARIWLWKVYLAAVADGVPICLSAAAGGWHEMLGPVSLDKFIWHKKAIESPICFRFSEAFEKKHPAPVDLIRRLASGQSSKWKELKGKSSDKNLKVTVCNITNSSDIFHFIRKVRRVDHARGRVSMKGLS